MRWSGLAIRDAVTLERRRLSENGELFLYRAKTGSPVYVPLPPDVAESLRNIPPGPSPNPRYFSWSGNGSPKSVVGNWQRSFRRLFTIANLHRDDGSLKRCHCPRRRSRSGSVCDGSQQVETGGRRADRRQHCEARPAGTAPPDCRKRRGRGRHRVRQSSRIEGPKLRL